MVMGGYNPYKERVTTTTAGGDITQQQQQKQIVIQVSGPRPLAPAPTLTDLGSNNRLPYMIHNNDSNNGSNHNNSKKKSTSLLFNSGSTQLPHQSTSVQRRNARERNRVKQVNNGFAQLRSKIPVALDPNSRASSTSPTNSGQRSTSKKLSKVETLRLAVEYIKSLEQLIEDSYKEELNNDYYDNATSPNSTSTTTSLLQTNYPNLSSISSTSSSGSSLQTVSPPISPPSSPTNNYNNSNFIQQTFVPIKLTEIYESGNGIETIHGNPTQTFDNYENFDNYPEETLLRHIITWENDAN